MTTDAMSPNTEAATPPRELSFAAVQELVADCLAIDPGEILPESKFFDDLGGESIDLLELSFVFEKVFHIRAPYKAFNNKELWERDEAGELTPAARELMRRDFGYLELERRLAAAGLSNPKGVLTIEMMYLMLQHA